MLGLDPLAPLPAFPITLTHQKNPCPLLPRGSCTSSRWRSRRTCTRNPGRLPAAAQTMKAVLSAEERAAEARRSGGEGRELYDAIVIGSGMGGLVAATQLAAKEARVLVLEKYVIRGGSSGFYERDGFTFDVGSSVMFGFSDKGEQLKRRNHETSANPLTRH